MFKWLATFLGGKKADIFDDKGEVCHKLPDEMWEGWNNRYKDPKTANWRIHKGTQTKK